MIRLPRVEESREIFSEFCAGIVEYLLECRQPRREYLFDLFAARVQRACDAVDALTHGIRHLGAALDQRLGDAGARRFEFLGDVAAAQVEVEDDRFTGGLESGVDLVGARGDRLRELARCIDDRVGEFLGRKSAILRAPDHVSTIAERFLRKALGDAVEPRRHHVFQTACDLGEFLADVVGLEIQVAT